MTSNVQKSRHFAVVAARKVLRVFPDQETYVCESGFTPSGKIHLGNFNDFCIADAVCKVLTKYFEQKAYHIIAIDSRDPFRQAPVFAPEEFKRNEDNYRGLPFDEVEDPWGCHNNYAVHFAEKIIESLPEYDIDATIMWARQIHTNKDYIELLAEVLRRRKEVRRIFNNIRRKAGHRKLYPENWIPFRPQCKKCRILDERVVPVEVIGKYQVKYKCANCGYEGYVDIRRGEGKPPWRVDWPLRWLLFNVHFEPLGKDLMVSGSSYETGASLVEKMFNRKPPVSVFYDFVYWVDPGINMDLVRKGLIKPSKFSKRRGVGLGIHEWIKYAPPEVLRFMILRRDVKNIESEALKHWLFNPVNIPDYAAAYETFKELYRECLEGLSKDKPCDRVIVIYELSKTSKPDPLVSYKLALEIAKWMYDEEDGINILRKMGKIPKEARPEEIQRTKELLRMAKSWLSEYESYLKPTEEAVKKSLMERWGSRAFLILKTLITMVEDGTLNEENYRGKVREIALKYNVKVREVYKIIYIAVHGEAGGPPLNRLLRQRQRLIKMIRSVLGYKEHLED